MLRLSVTIWAVAPLSLPSWTLSSCLSPLPGSTVMLLAGGGTDAAFTALGATDGFGGTGVFNAAPARVALALAGGRTDSLTRLGAVRGSLRRALLDEVAMIPRGKKERFP